MPNLRLDELSGRAFSYKLSKDGNKMTGNNRGLDGRRFGVTATGLAASKPIDKTIYKSILKLNLKSN